MNENSGLHGCKPNSKKILSHLTSNVAAASLKGFLSSSFAGEKPTCGTSIEGPLLAKPQTFHRIALMCLFRLLQVNLAMGRRHRDEAIPADGIDRSIAVAPVAECRDSSIHRNLGVSGTS